MKIVVTILKLVYDGIFVTWPYDRNSLNTFLNRLNNITRNMKFGMEIELNKSLPFFDNRITSDTKNNLYFLH